MFWVYIVSNGGGRAVKIPEGKLLDIKKKLDRWRLGHMFRTSHIIAIGLAVGVIAWVASGAVIGNAPSKVKGLQKKLVPLTVVRVKESYAERHERHLTLFGRTKASRSVDIAAETTVKIITRVVEKGSWVTKGTPIIKLAMDDRPAWLNEAKAKVDYQTLAYESAKKLSKKQFQSSIEKKKNPKLIEKYLDNKIKYDS